MARAQLNADRLARAGLELADELGFELITVAELARRVGVKQASLYSHIASGAELKTRIALLALEEIDELVTDAVAGRAGKEALRGLADAYRDYAVAHPGRFAAAVHPLDTATAVASAGKRQSNRMRAILRGYPLAEAEEVHAIRMIGSTIRGFVSLELSGSFGHSAPVPSDSWARMIDALDTVLRDWPTPDTRRI